MKKHFYFGAIILLLATFTASGQAAHNEFGEQIATSNGSGYQTDYLNSVKLTFLSWLSGSTKLSYERAIPQLNQSGEICASLICAGYDKYNNNLLKCFEEAIKNNYNLLKGQYDAGNTKEN
jgi:hypothetical protein